MVNGINIHEREKWLKPCISLKWQAFQLFLDILISMGNVEKSHSAALICPWCLPWQCQGAWEHAATHLQLSGSCRPAPGSEDLERQKGRANKCALPGVTQPIK